MNRPQNRDDGGLLLTAEQVARRYNLNRGKIHEIGKAAGALLKIGRATRYDARAMDDYVFKHFKAEQ